MSGPVAQLGWSVRLIIERSAVQIRLGPPINPLRFKPEEIKEETYHCSNEIRDLE